MPTRRPTPEADETSVFLGVTGRDEDRAPSTSQFTHHLLFQSLTVVVSYIVPQECFETSRRTHTHAHGAYVLRAHATPMLHFIRGLVFDLGVGLSTGLLYFLWRGIV